MGIFCCKVREEDEIIVREIDKDRVEKISELKIERKRKYSISSKPICHKVLGDISQTEQIMFIPCLRNLAFTYECNPVFIFYTKSGHHYYTYHNDINSKEILEVVDCTKECDKTAITILYNKPQLRPYYLFCPITSENLVHVGFLCLLGIKEHTFTPEERNQLLMISDQIITILLKK